MANSPIEVPPKRHYWSIILTIIVGLIIASILGWWGLNLLQPDPVGPDDLRHVDVESSLLATAIMNDENLQTDVQNQNTSGRPVIITIYKPNCSICNNLRKYVSLAAAADHSSDPVVVLNYSTTSQTGRQLIKQFHAPNQRLLITLDNQHQRFTVYTTNLQSPHVVNTLTSSLNLKIDHPTLVSMAWQ